MKRFFNTKQIYVVAVIFFAFSWLLMENIQRYYLSEKYQSFRNDQFIISYLKEPRTQNPFTNNGLRFSSNEDLKMPVSELKNMERFTMIMLATIFRLNMIHIRLNGAPQSADVSLSADLDMGIDPNREITIKVERYHDHIDLQVGDKLVQSINLSGQTFDGFYIEDFSSDFFIRSISFKNEENEIFFSYILASSVFKTSRKVMISLAFAAFLMLLTAAITRKRKHKSLFRGFIEILYCFIPMLVGTVFSLPVPLFHVLALLFVISLLLLISKAFFRFSGTGWEKISILLFVLAIIALVAALMPKSGTVITIAGLLWGSAIIVWASLAISGNSPSNLSSALSTLTTSLVPAVFWIPALFIFGDNYNSICAMLCMVSVVLILFTIFEKNERARTYTLLVLVVSISFLATAELTARYSNEESSYRPMSTGTGFKPDNTLFFVPGDLFSDNASFGLRKLKFRSGPTEKQAAPETYRIMIMGGSTTYGDGIDSNDMTFSGVLQKCLDEKLESSVEVINAGVKGYNLFQILKLFELFALDYKPELLVLNINGQDLAVIRGPYTLRELWKMKNEGHLDSIVQEGENSAGSFWITRTQKVLQRFRLYNALVRAVVKTRQETLAPISERFGAIKDVNPIEDYKLNLLRIIQLCEENKITLVFMDEFYYNHVEEGELKGRLIRGFMKETAASEGISLLPINDELQKHLEKDSLVFRHDRAHPSVKGHEVIGNRLCEFLLDTHLK